MSIAQQNQQAIMPTPAPLMWQHIVQFMNATVRESEQQLLNEVQPGQLWRVQALDIPDLFGDDGAFRAMANMVTQTFGSDRDTCDIVLTQIENLSVLVHTLRKCEDLVDYVNLLVVACRFYTGKPFTVFLKSRVDEIFRPSEVQALDSGELLRTLRGLFDNTQNAMNCPLAKKLCSLYSYLLTQGFLKAFGLSITDGEYSSFEIKALKHGFSSKKALILCAFDTTLFICERLQEYRQTGEISAFTHSGEAYSKWYDESSKLLALAPFLGNLGAHGTSMFEFVGKLNELEDQGQSMVKIVRAGGMGDQNAIARRLQELQMLKNSLVTRKAAQQERAAPMGVLIYGQSSVGKSTFTKMLFNYYGGLFNLARGDQYRYVRNPMDEYWSNFDTSKWCIQLDDIAFLNPSKSSEVDSTLKDLLNVVNNVPYVPPQAAIEDKGKTPVLAELVLATSNTEHLHAHEYFACPLAIRRRLPYVIKIVPKPEYRHDNGVFLDPSKLELNAEGFPNWWIISVYKVVPVLGVANQARKPGEASLRLVREFVEVNEFLQHFGNACKEHKENQARAMANDIDMSHIEICQSCQLPLPHETCSPLQVQFGCREVHYHLRNAYVYFWFTLYRMVWVHYMVRQMARYRATRWIAGHMVRHIAPDNVQVHLIGEMFTRRVSERTKKVLLALGVCSMIVASYFLVSSGLKSQTRRKKKARGTCESSEKLDDEPKMDLQGNALMTTQKDLAKEDVGNVWYRSDVELTPWDMPPSRVPDNSEVIRDRFGRNTVLLRIRPHGADKTRWMRGLFVNGHNMITNAHAFEPGYEHYTVTIVQAAMDVGVSPNLEFELERSEVVFHDSLDLCAVRVASIPLFKDITGYWATKRIPFSAAIELIRQVDGVVKIFDIWAVQFQEMDIPSIPMPQPIYHGLSPDNTEEGMCGSVAIAMTPRGGVIVGLHLLGRDKHAGFMCVLLSDIQQLLQDPRMNRTPVISKPFGMPKLGLQGGEHTLTALHRKSIFNFIEKGTLNVYGRLSGHRAEPKSNVCPTPLHDKMLDFYGVENKYGQPVMKGWLPWRINVVEMIKPRATYKRAVLRKCVDAYLDDVVKGLTEKYGEAWKGELVHLDNRAALNGLPGVKFIDRVNTSSSMGFPWGCTKKRYIEDDPDEDYPDGIDFTAESEVWERVREIERIYAERQRAYPIFTGHLKDEATPFRKIEKGKTRLFSGAPVDFSIVVRKNLLSFVRLVQKNRTIFEASPGLVTQSEEWGELYEFLTKFGTDRMIAGDYAWFDKNMLADFMLAAFEIMYRLHRTAGFSEDEAIAIMCIGEDISFPMTNLNGDLVEFFGTNPSGHPLTVVLNSLVNCLYMRYCYHELNPEHEVVSFRKNVALTTYGDDNEAGVSEEAPWFNHTAIVGVLASIGVTYTMADKEAESVPFVPIERTSFLKRKWVYDEETQAWLAPLDEESIIKSLTMWVPSKTLDKHCQMVRVIESANNEYFFHGRRKHEKMHKFFTEILSESPYSAYVTKSTLLSFDELMARFNRHSG